MARNLPVAIDGPIEVGERLLWSTPDVAGNEEMVTVTSIEKWKDAETFIRLTNSRSVERWYSEETVRARCRRVVQ